MFSTNPSSPDCVFLISYSDGHKFVVMTCRQGDNGWKIRKFDDFVCGLYMVEYINGNFYFVSSLGRLALHNIMSGEFEIEKLNRDDYLNQLFNSQMQFLVFKLKGELTIL